MIELRHKKPSMKRQRGDVQVYNRPVQNYAYQQGIPKQISMAPEKKYYDWTSAAVTLTGNTWVQTPIPIYNIIQGNGVSQREGNAIRCFRITLRFVVERTYGETIANRRPSMERMVFAWDSQCNGANCVGNDIAGGTGALTNNILSFINLENADRFTIIKDKMMGFDNIYAFGATSAAVTPQARKFVKANWQGDQIIKFKANAGAVTDLTSFNPVCFWNLSETPFAGTTVTVGTVGRIVFSD